MYTSICARNVDKTHIGKKVVVDWNDGRDSKCRMGVLFQVTPNALILVLKHVDSNGFHHRCIPRSFISQVRILN